MIEFNKENLGDFAISYNLLNTLANIFLPNTPMIEIGSGDGTKELAKYFDVYSIEYQKQWLSPYSKESVHAPLQIYSHNNMMYQWFNKDKVSSFLKNKEYYFVLVDSPEGVIGREGILYNIDMFKDVSFIIDDTHRKDEQEIVKELIKLRSFNDMFDVVDDNKKSTILLK